MSAYTLDSFTLFCIESCNETPNHATSRPYRPELVLVGPGAHTGTGTGAGSDAALRQMQVRAAAEAADNMQKEAACAGQPVMCSTSFSCAT